MERSRFAQMKIALDIKEKEAVGNCGISYNWARVLVTALVIFCMTACGKQTDKVYEPDKENPIEGAAGPQTGIVEETTVGNGEEEEADENKAAGTDREETDGSETDDVIMAYVTEDIEYSVEVMPVQYVDDLSLLEAMKYTNSTYAYQDGKIYYRRYHEDSYEETALWGMYDPVPETKKEIVCIDSDGIETELFTDAGYGDIYLINDRFYMTDLKLREENGSVSVDSRLYSVDMQGNDRIDHGTGSIFAIDQVRNIFILQMWEANRIHYYVMNAETGEKTPIDLGDGYIDVKIYRDGWLYYTISDLTEDIVCRLCAISLEGEKREIIALTSEINKRSSAYRESIQQLEVDEDRVYFVFGGYDGTAHVFQGGMLISVRLDGTDYRAVATEWDDFYLCHRDEKTLLYFPCFPMDPDTKYNMYVWDINANQCCLTDYPRQILERYCAYNDWKCRYDLGMKGAVCEWTTYGDDPRTDIYAVPDDSGRVVRIVMDLESYITKKPGEETGWGEYWSEYQNWYYADGFLYFGIEYRTYDPESSIGWRDGYRRLRTEVYRLKIGESAAEMLYSY